MLLTAGQLASAALLYLQVWETHALYILKMMSTPVAIILMNMTTIAEVSSLFADVDAGHSNLVIMHRSHCTLAFLSPNNDDEDEHQNLCSTDHFNCGQCPISEFANLGA